MTGLPLGWNWTKVGDVVKFTQKPRNLRYADYDFIPFVPMEKVPIGRARFYEFLLKKPHDLTSGTYFEAGDVLVAKITPSFENGKQGIIDALPTPFAIGSTEIIPLQAIPGVSDRDFLFYYLLGTDVRAELASKMEGTTGRQRLSKAVLEAYPIALPPLPEQLAIAAAMGAVQNARDARRRELDAERERKAALMEDLFTIGTRGEPRVETALGPLPQSWGVVSLGDVAPFVQYGTSEKCEADQSGTPVLRIPNVIGGRVDVTDLKHANLPEKATEGLRLVRGDLLFVRTNGNRENTGRCAMYDNDPPSALFASYLIRARLDTGRAQPRFVQFYTTTGKGKEYLSGRASNAADGKFNINSQTIKGVQMPLPPLDEQRDIAEVLTACDAKIAALESEAALHDELFRALLEELMSGRLSALPLVGAVAPHE